MTVYKLPEGMNFNNPQEKEAPPPPTTASIYKLPKGITFPQEGEVKSVEGFGTNFMMGLRTPKDLWKNESLPSQLIKWMSTPEEVYAKKEEMDKKERIRSSPAVKNIGDLLDRYEEIQQERDLTKEEENRFLSLQDYYGKLWDEASNKVDAGQDWSWSDLWEGIKNNPGGAAAEFANAIIADPELIAVPQMLGAKVAASFGTAGRVIATGLTGAMVADVDATVRGLAEENKIDKKDIALASAIGFFSNAALRYGGEKLVALRNLRESQGKEVDVPSVEEILKEAKVEADPRTIAEIINQQTGVTKTDTRSLAKATSDMKAAWKKEIINPNDSPDVVQYKEKHNSYIDYLIKEEELYNWRKEMERDPFDRMAANIKPAKDMTPQQIIDDVVGVKDRTDAQIKKDVARSRRQFHAALKDDPEMTAFYEKEANNAILERDISRRQIEQLKQEQIDSIYQADKAKVDNKKIEDLWVEQEHRNLHKQVTEILEGRKEARFVQEQNPDQLSTMEHAFDRALERNQAYIDELEFETNLSQYLKQGRLDAQARSSSKYNEYISMLGRLTKEDMEMNNKPGFKGGKESGAIDRRLLTYMASGTAVAAGTYAWTQDPADIPAAAIAGVAVPYLFTRGYVMPMGIKEWARTPDAALLQNAWGTQRPLSAIRNYGEAGHTFANLIEDFNNAMDLRIANKMDHLDTSFKSITREEQQQVAQLLRRSIDPKSVRSEVIQAAKAIEKDLDGILDEAVQYGVYTPEQATKLRARVKEQGYFPRVYDTIYLQSQAGKDKWVELWTSHSWSKESLTNALKSIVGEGKDTQKYIDNVVRLARKDGKVLKLTSQQARELFQRNGRRLMTTRSSHLERGRTIFPEAEALLEPFLLKDTSSTLMQYYHDVYRRIEAAAVFDAKDPKTGKWITDGKALALMDDIGSDPAHGANAYEVAKETYYTLVGDPVGSDIIRNAARTPEFIKTWQRRASDYETITKLSMAQMPNMLQAWNFGTLKMINGTNNFTESYMIALKAMKNSWTKEGKEFAKLTGAANETTLLQYMAESSSQSGKAAEKFLKYTGFLGAEKIQRNYAANIGKAYAESLLNKFQKIKAGDKKISAKEKARVIAAMEELRLPTDRPVTDADMYRAGLRFSNEVNFRNTPDQLPLGFNSNYGKLVRKFKSFAFNSGRFVKENVIKPAVLYGATAGKEGSLKPLLAFSIFAPATGATVDELRRMIKNDDRDLTMTERYIRAITLIGGIGLTQDAVMSAYRSESGLMGFVAGPAVGDVSAVGHAVMKSIEEGDTYPLESTYLRTLVVPFKGKIEEQIRRPSGGGSTNPVDKLLDMGTQDDESKRNAIIDKLLGGQ